jgi:hypothetical protein
MTPEPRSGARDRWGAKVNTRCQSVHVAKDRKHGCDVQPKVQVVKVSDRGEGTISTQAIISRDGQKCRVVLTQPKQNVNVKHFFTKEDKTTSVKCSTTE